MMNNITINKSKKVSISKNIDEKNTALPLPPVDLITRRNDSNKGCDERKSSSPLSKLDDNYYDNDNNDNLAPKVMELVTPFITDYVFDINDIQIPKKLLYEGITLLIFILMLISNNY